MKWQEPLLEGQFIKRYKRFFAEIQWNGQVITAHLPNTGSLLSCVEIADKAWFTPANNPQRKLQYTLQFLHTPSSWVGVNTSLANTLVWELFEGQQVEAWKNYECGKREVKISPHTRIDLVLWPKSYGINPSQPLNMDLFKEKKFHFIEVKNVSLMKNSQACFPDATTTRGQKHLIELMELMEQGHTCELVFVVQRQDCQSFSPEKEIDPRYTELFYSAIKKGLIVSPFPCQISQSEIYLDSSKKLEVIPGMN